MVHKLVISLLGKLDLKVFFLKIDVSDPDLFVSERIWPPGSPSGSIKNKNKKQDSRSRYFSFTTKISLLNFCDSVKEKRKIFQRHKKLLLLYFSRFFKENYAEIKLRFGIRTLFYNAEPGSGQKPYESYTLPKKIFTEFRIF